MTDQTPTCLRCGSKNTYPDEPEYPWVECRDCGWAYKPKDVTDDDKIEVTVGRIRTLEKRLEEAEVLVKQNADLYVSKNAELARLRSRLAATEPVRVSERLPTEEDATKDGYIEIYQIEYEEIEEYELEPQWWKVQISDLHLFPSHTWTHWRRINNTPPEPEKNDE